MNLKFLVLRSIFENDKNIAIIKSAKLTNKYKRLILSLKNGLRLETKFVVSVGIIKNERQIINIIANGMMSIGQSNFLISFLKSFIKTSVLLDKYVQIS